MKLIFSNRLFIFSGERKVKTRGVSDSLDYSLVNTKQSKRIKNKRTVLSVNIVSTHLKKETSVRLSNTQLAHILRISLTIFLCIVTMKYTIWYPFDYALLSYLIDTKKLP